MRKSGDMVGYICDFEGINFKIIFKFTLLKSEKVPPHFSWRRLGSDPISAKPTLPPISKSSKKLLYSMVFSSRKTPELSAGQAVTFHQPTDFIGDCDFGLGQLGLFGRAAHPHPFFGMERCGL